MKPIVLGLAAAVALGGAAQAADMTMGEYEYNNSCAVCHGLDGKSGGEFAEVLTVRPPDLTVLQKNNGGVFPVQRVFDMIDGRDMLAAHGTRDMPIWGRGFERRAEEEGTDYPFPPGERAAYARTRILALIEYLSTLQAN